MSEVDLWGSLPSDPLNKIAELMYCYDDYVRLRSVCKSWCLNLPKIPNCTRNPWLVLPFAGDSVDSPRLAEQGIHPLRLPEMQKNVMIRGSCHGCLITVGISDGAMQILNPFTKVSYDLPPVSTFPDIVSYQPENIGDEYIMRDMMNRYPDHPVERIHMNRTEVWKIILSSPPDRDFIAVAIYGDYMRLAFYRIGDSCWTDIPIGESEGHFEDVIFHNGKIYAVNWEAQLYEFDIHTKPLPLGRPSEAKPPMLEFCPFSELNLKYLVGCPNGDLLMVVRQFFHDPYRTIKFYIYVLTKKEPIWSRLHTLGNYALMIGFNSSVLVPPTSHPNRNRIYYTDNLMEQHVLEGLCDRLTGGHDIGVFDLEVEDNTNNQLFPNTEWLCPPPVFLLV